MNANGMMTAIPHPNVTAEMDLQYCDIIINAARTVEKGVMDVKVN